ncbi:MAG: MarR family transcriptional regulator, partial [Candidatus Hodarchaeota archaeon]
DYSRYKPILIQEPVNTSILIHAFKKKFNMESKISLISDLTEELENIVSRRENIILLIDEAQELVINENDTKDIIEEKNKTLQWIRVLADFRGCRVFLTGLINFSKKLNEMFRPLEDRVTLNFTLNPLDLESTIELIKERIRYFSVEDTKTILSPFTDDAYMVIYQISGGYPRAILKLAQDSLLFMLQNARESIDSNMVMHVLPEQEQKHIALSPSIKDLQKIEAKELEQEVKSFRENMLLVTSQFTPTEVQVLEYMATREELTPSEIAEGCDITPGTAANILRKLKDMDYVYRKKKGRTHSYTLYSVYRREFMHA